MNVPRARADGTGVIIAVNGDEHRVSRRDAREFLKSLTRAIVDSKPPSIEDDGPKYGGKVRLPSGV